LTPTVAAYSEHFGNAREDTEVVVDNPANDKKKAETPENSAILPQLKPLRGVELPRSGQAPKAAFKPSERPLVELPRLGDFTGPPRLPSDLLLIETPTGDTHSQPPLLSASNLHKDDLDSLLRDVEAI
jgi:hypothetical protein